MLQIAGGQSQAVSSVGIHVEASHGQFMAVKDGKKTAQKAGVIH